MKIFSWMQSKLHAIRDTKKLNPFTSNDNIQQEPSKDEFSDWTHGLLTIGTFGEKNVKEIPNNCNLQTSNHSQHHQKDITPQEVGNLKEDLNGILAERQGPESNSADELERHNILLDKFLKSSSNSNTERTSSFTASVDIGDEDSSLQRISGTRLMNRGKDNYSDNTKNAIKKESLTFLLKMMLRSSPNSRDAPPEVRLEKSRMDKIFRTMLSKKIFPQSFNPKANSIKKYLNNKQHCVTDGKNILPEEMTAGSKWVNTDSVYIVLEI
ncbi:protein NEGATIVE GRAVITROPIC RESPONSE OF ROOTS-like [Apium graveolens]|uniref:protein NEGATIVE GRAVITROPIC RESPONSE OF ROOTS-like n=1 Tax=Apium graveolens TaxID=4045 RepID=UPI003D79CC33